MTERNVVPDVDPAASDGWAPFGWEPMIDALDDAPFGSVLGDPLMGSPLYDVSVLDAVPGWQPEDTGPDDDPGSMRAGAHDEPKGRRRAPGGQAGGRGGGAAPPPPAGPSRKGKRSEQQRQRNRQGQDHAPNTHGGQGRQGGTVPVQQAFADPYAAAAMVERFMGGPPAGSPMPYGTAPQMPSRRVPSQRGQGSQRRHMQGQGPKRRQGKGQGSQRHHKQGPRQGPKQTGPRKQKRDKSVDNAGWLVLVVVFLLYLLNVIL